MTVYAEDSPEMMVIVIAPHSLFMSIELVMTHYFEGNTVAIISQEIHCKSVNNAYFPVIYDKGNIRPTCTETKAEKLY